MRKFLFQIAVFLFILMIPFIWTISKADGNTDVDTYLFIAKSLKIDLGDSTEFTEIRNKVWDVYKDLPTTDINRLYDLFNPSYDK